LKSCRTRTGVAATATAVAAILVASCSSSSHSSESSATTTGSSHSTGQSTSCSTSGVRGVTASTITVGGLVTVLDFGSGVGPAAEARIAQANNDGEIPCGRKIKLVDTLDDQGSPTTNLSAIRTLVQADHVFAIVPADTPFIEAGELYLNQNHVPLIGWGVSPSFCTSSNFSEMYVFGFNGCLSPSAPYTYETAIAGPLTAKLLELQGKTAAGSTVAIIGDQSDSSKIGVTSIATQDEAAGLKVVYTQNPMPAPPATVTDFSPYVQALMTSSGGKPPDVITSTSGPSLAFPLATALHQAGYQGVIEHQTYAPQVVAAAKDTYANNTFATTESSTPAMQQIVATLHAGGITTIGQPELSGYIAADMFIQILKKVGPDLTPERFQQVAANFTYEIPGVIGPVYYPAGFQAGAPCGEEVFSNGTKWTIAVPYQCFGQDYKLENGKYVPVPYPSGVTS
jgi:ABC-type branched-subunit amino acid transport system substrate-binding protein